MSVDSRSDLTDESPSPEWIGTQGVNQDLHIGVEPEGRGRVTAFAITGSGANAGQVKAREDFKVVDQTVMFGLCPVGSVLAFAGHSAPAGWLFCDGQKYLVADYGQLAAVIGGAFNQQGDDDALNFRVPNLQGRFVLGLSSGSGGVTEKGLGKAPAAVGVIGGQEAVSLSVDQLPTHGHSIGPHGHDSSLTITKDGDHNHRIHLPAFSPASNLPKTSLIDFSDDRSPATDAEADSAEKTLHFDLLHSRSAGEHAHSGSAVSVHPAAAAATGASGGGQGFSLVPPALVLNYIIRARV